MHKPKLSLSVSVIETENKNTRSRYVVIDYYYQWYNNSLDTPTNTVWNYCAGLGVLLASEIRGGICTEVGLLAHLSPNFARDVGSLNAVLGFHEVTYTYVTYSTPWSAISVNMQKICLSGWNWELWSYECVGMQFGLTNSPATIFVKFVKLEATEFQGECTSFQQSTWFRLN